MPHRLILVSCGQRTESEINIGRGVSDLINETEGYEAYFAENVQNLTALSEHIFDALRRCSGAVVLLHPRGKVLTDDNLDLGVRSSVWINQEVALLAYRQFFEGNTIPILSFKHEDVVLEGAMTSFIINPLPLGDQENILEQVSEWLTNEALNGENSQQDIFDTKWAVLQNYDYIVLDALIDEGRFDIKQTSVRLRMSNQHGVERNQTSDILRNSLTRLTMQNLVRTNRNVNDGAEMSLHPTWEWYVLHAITKRHND